MIPWSMAATVVVGLVLAKWAAQEGLDWLNRSHVLKHRDAVPKSFEGMIDEATYRKSSDYTLAKSKLEQIDTAWNVVVLLAALFTGVLPCGYSAFAKSFGTSAWAMGAFLFAVGLALSLTGMPLEWYHQFRLEERFGF